MDITMTKMLGFSVFLFAGVLLYWFFVPEKRRSLFLFLISLFFIALFSVKYASYFLLNVAVVYTGGIFIERENKNKKLILKLMLIWIIGNLLFFKYVNLLLNSISKMGFQLSLIPKIEFPKILLPLGISYITFRLVHYIVEVYRKNVPRSSFVDFALYVLFFPTFLAGPVERFQRFQPQTTERKNLNISDVKRGLFRIICGIVKKFLIADNLAKLIMPVLRSPESSTRVIIIFSIYVLTIWIYMDFSGYTDMAIGVARLFGYKIMENFNRPFFQKNIALFWKSWHISVHSWIRDYFFFPLFGYRASNVKIYIGIFLTMMVFMLWHRGNLNFLILGIYHGLGLVVWHIFQEVKIKYPSIRKLFTKPYLNPLSIFFTFSFVSFSFIIFSLDMYSIGSILDKIF